MSDVHNYLAIDPGERWIGCAILQQERRGWRGKSILMDTKKRTLESKMLALCLLIDDAEMIVCEDFRFRPTGFNAFNAGVTLRLIGAIEFYTKLSPEKSFRLVQPGRAAHVKKLWPSVTMINRIFTDDHTRSAWRALGAHLLTAHPTVLRLFDGAPL